MQYWQHVQLDKKPENETNNTIDFSSINATD